MIKSGKLQCFIRPRDQSKRFLIAKDSPSDSSEPSETGNPILDVLLNHGVPIPISKGALQGDKRPSQIIDGVLQGIYKRILEQNQLQIANRIAESPVLSKNLLISGVTVTPNAFVQEVPTTTLLTTTRKTTSTTISTSTSTVTTSSTSPTTRSRTTSVRPKFPLDEEFDSTTPRDKLQGFNAYLARMIESNRERMRQMMMTTISPYNFASRIREEALLRPQPDESRPVNHFMPEAGVIHNFPSPINPLNSPKSHSPIESSEPQFIPLLTSTEALRTTTTTISTTSVIAAKKWSLTDSIFKHRVFRLKFENRTRKPGET